MRQCIGRRTMSNGLVLVELLVSEVSSLVEDLLVVVILLPYVFKGRKTSHKWCDDCVMTGLVITSVRTWDSKNGFEFFELSEVINIDVERISHRSQLVAACCP